LISLLEGFNAIQKTCTKKTLEFFDVKAIDDELTVRKKAELKANS
jgi:hypothetical protein